jgi:ribosome maturation factor RimP
MGIESRIADLAAPGAAANGLIVDAVEVTSSGPRSRVLVTLDLPEDQVGSASLDAIADASRAIGAALDEANVPETAYTLEVSTPGVSRPLTERRHFMRARTRLVTLDLADGTTASGRLTDVSEQDIELDGERTLPLAAVVRGEIQVEFKREEG